MSRFAPTIVRDAIVRLALVYQKGPTIEVHDISLEQMHTLGIQNGAMYKHNKTLISWIYAWREKYPSCGNHEISFNNKKISEHPDIREAKQLGPPNMFINN